MTDHPERISISPVYRQKRADDFYLVDRDAFPGKGTEYVRADIHSAAIARAETAEAEVARLREALTPSADTKATYMGEIECDCPTETGRHHVPWTSTKNIMAMIRSRAALAQEGDVMTDDLVKRLREGVGMQVGAWPVMIHEAADRIEALQAEVQELALQALASNGQAAENLNRAVMSEAEVARLREALTPSADTKAAYIGEIECDCPTETWRHYVPWTSTKNIMAMIRSRAALAQEGDVMTDDLVKRLRDRGVCSLAHNSCRNVNAAVIAADRIEALERQIAAADNLAGWVEGIIEDGCPKCGGDCSSANPPVAYCPMREATQDLAAYQATKEATT